MSHVTSVSPMCHQGMSPVSHQGMSPVSHQWGLPSGVCHPAGDEVIRLEIEHVGGDSVVRWFSGEDALPAAVDQLLVVEPVDAAVAESSHGQRGEVGAAHAPDQAEVLLLGDLPATTHSH